MTASSDALLAARAFVHAIRWGEHTMVWSLLSDDGRETALSVALTNGLDRVTASRISDDVSDPVDLEEFLARLLGGLRRDLRSVDIDRLEASDPPEVQPDGRVAVDLTNPSIIPGTDHWAAGRLVMSIDTDGEWRVDRLVPRLAGP